MSIRRIFIGLSQISEKEIIVSDKEILHRLQKVLRLKNDDKIQVFCNKNQEFLAKISEINKSEIKLEILEKISPIILPKPEINIYQALTKPISKFENMLQKATELGVNNIIPIITKFTESKNLGKIERMQNILIGASEQCGRSEIPTLEDTISFSEITKNPPTGLNILTYENEKNNTLAEILPEIKSREVVNVFIGPEGGWEENEIKSAQENGFQIVNLGDIILRSETVAPAILALIRLS